MMDPRNELMIPPASSPTNSSISSSDFDTESTGSFFHDRSITLGTLMGVSFPAITFRASSQHHHASPAASISLAARSSKRRQTRGPSTERQRRRKWWRLCRDDGDDAAGACNGDSGGRPSSLGDYLEVERRSGDESFYGGAELDGMILPPPAPVPNGGRMLFADGRVLPPATAEEAGEDTAATSAIWRFPGSLTGICSGGVG